MKQTILVTGGAGYIGSHTVLELLQRDYHVVVIDKLCSLQINHPHVTYFQCDIADTQAVKTICTYHTINAVIHCAASIEVGASVVNPADYYHNNVIHTILFLDTLRACGINQIIFSSSAAVYGMPEKSPLHEDDPCAPISPYGMTKLIIEKLLMDYHTAYGLHALILRYFNVAGAYPEFQLGERHHPETHLIPRLLHAAIHNQEFTLFGNDYDTVDGTCVRDYLHVRDIGRAHIHALEYLITMRENNTINQIINLGTGHGFSIKEIIATVEKITRTTVRITKMPRRAGDPAYLIADTKRAHKLLNWKPIHSDIDAVIGSSYEAYSISHNRPSTLAQHTPLAVADKP